MDGSSIDILKNDGLSIDLTLNTFARIRKWSIANIFNQLLFIMFGNRFRKCEIEQSSSEHQAINLNVWVWGNNTSAEKLTRLPINYP